ncbi:hypothetical protein D3C81_1773350 [compost metagenome]
MVADLDAAGGDAGDGGLDLAEAVQHQVGAGLGELARNAQADAAGGAGDQCGLAFEVHGNLLSVVRPDASGRGVA